MHPQFLIFPAYETMLLLGFGVAMWLGRRAEDRAGKNGDRIVDLGLLMLVCGVAGARLLSVTAEGHFLDFVHRCTDPTRVAPDDAWARALSCASDAACAPYLCDPLRHACYPPRDCLAALEFWNGGLAYYGGFLAAVPAGLWYARRKRLGGWRVADLTAPLIALGLAFGRLGCFFTGCCYGAATTVPWGMRFPGHPGPVHPTQLYESAGALLIFGLLTGVVQPRKRAHGQVFAALLVLYGALRFVLELWRDDERGTRFGLSTSQWIGIPLVLLGAWLYLDRQRKAKAWQPLTA
jgi:phosphatidylglycerol---prolipoprotein diacylglyceryl transferase